jgi:tetratricopeptide (TPR) repeat protein
MSWSTWFSKKQPPEPGRATLQSVRFDTTGWRVDKKTHDSIEWRDLDGDLLVTRLAQIEGETSGPPPTLTEIRSSFRAAAAPRKGGIVSVEQSHRCGLVLTKAITKFEDLPAYAYEGTLEIPLRNATYSLSLMAGEHGTTGIREAVTTAQLFQLRELKIPAGGTPGVGQKLEGWFRDPYDADYHGPTLRSLSDDDRLDALFPKHPLSKIRKWFAKVEDTLSIDADVRPDALPSAGAEGAEDATERPSHRMSAFAVGMLYLQTGRRDVAEKFLAESIPLQDGEPPLDDVDVAQKLMCLGLARECQAKGLEAEWAFTRSLRGFQATAGENDPKTMLAVSNLARLYAGLGRPDDADPLLVKVIPFYEAANKDSELAVALNAKGLVEQARGRHREAILKFERALFLFERAHGPDFADCATVLRNLSRSLEANGDRAASKNTLARAEAILSKYD